MYKDWYEMLPFALYEYRTAIKMSTGATPYFFIYRMEAIISLEEAMSSLRILMESKLKEDDWVNMRYEELNLVSEKRLVVICHHQLYQQIMAKAYDKKIKSRVFEKEI
jgi:hypothetical protein